MKIKVGDIVRWRTLDEADEVRNATQMSREYGLWNFYLRDATEHIMAVVHVNDNSDSGYPDYGIQLLVGDLGLMWTMVDYECFDRISELPGRFFLEKV